jgi:hypothetical protein
VPDILIALAIILGFELPEEVVRPFTEKHELTRHDIKWYYLPSEIRDRLIRGASLPKLADSGHLPPLLFCEEMASINARHGSWLESQIEMFPDMPGLWKLQKRENDALGLFWRSARDCQQTYYDILSRRRDVQVAKDLLEPLDWATGYWPPPVPLHRFIP